MTELLHKVEYDRRFETSYNWILFTIFVSLFAVFIHSAGQTMFFSHGYFEEPNLYHTWDRFDEITHPLSSCAMTSIILNFNLPTSFRKKWIIALVFGIIFGVLWEILEFLAVPFGLVRMTFVDTMLDLHQDFYGSALSVLFYVVTMRESKIHPPVRFKL
jgi:hypothetical protein